MKRLNCFLVSAFLILTCSLVVSAEIYSRPYSVIAANVGNSSVGVPLFRADRLKLRPGSDEENKVKEEIQRLKPDILILVEAYDKAQVQQICAASQLGYTVSGGPYDYIAIKNDIIVKQNGKLDIVHKQIVNNEGNSIGYVNVGLKDADGRKVRLFYVHFPSSRGPFSEKENQTHVDAFLQIELMLQTPNPCFLSGDFNNDFIRQRDDSSIWSAQYICERVEKNGLWIFNPLSKSKAKDGPDGKTNRDYEGTYRVSEALPLPLTIDWAIGKNCRPPGVVLGSGSKSFVTSPPDWYKIFGSLQAPSSVFDHKPLSGQVVFCWEEAKTPVKYTGGRPFLLGKSRAEVEKILGHSAGLTLDGKGWRYNCKFGESIFTNVYFAPFANSEDPIYRPGPLSKTVQWACFKQGTAGQIVKVTPQQLVPKEILGAKPDEICWYPGQRAGLIVIWRLGGNTFALGVRDSRRDLSDEFKDGKIMPKRWKLNNAGLDFRLANDAFLFVQIAGQPELFGSKQDWESQTVYGSSIENRGRFGDQLDGYFYRFNN